MKIITRAAWNCVIEKACDVVNTTRMDDNPMYDVQRLKITKRVYAK